MSDEETAAWREQAVTWQRRATGFAEQLADAKAERDRLRAALFDAGLEAGRIMAERDLLRAVVDAVRRANHLYWIAESADFDDITPVTVAMTKVELMLSQLDASPTGEDT